MKKVIYVMSTFLVVCLIAAVSVSASTNSSRYLYLNNVSIPTGDGYTTSALDKTEDGFQYIVNRVNKSFRAYLYGYNTNHNEAGWNGTPYSIAGNQSGVIQNNSSEQNYGFGKGTTQLKLVSAGLFSRTFQGAWIPDKSFYDFAVENGVV